MKKLSKKPVAPKKESSSGSWTLTLNGSKDEAIKAASDFPKITVLQRAALVSAINSVDGPYLAGTLSGKKDGSGFLSVSLLGRTVR